MLGFIGAGNMAGALLHGAVQRNVLPAKEIHIFDVDKRKMNALQNELGVQTHESCAEMIALCDIVLMAIKPNVVGKVLQENREVLKGKALISIAAGWSVDMLRRALSAQTRILRVMPNTPALVGEGMAALSKAHSLTEEEAAFAQRLFSALGRVVWVEEYQMEAVTGMSGSGPAYAYLFIEAMADGGVACGLPRAQAIEMAAQTLLGSARMVLESGQHPGALKDMVCSPGGTTITAVRTLESSGFRGAVLDAVIAACEKAMELKQ